MRAGASPGCTSMFSTMLMKLTRWVVSCGARTVIETPSSARAMSAPNFSLIALTIAVVVVKSLSRTLSSTWSVLSKGFSTTFSTLAPPGMRDAVGTPIVTLEPAPPASTEVAGSGPWASA